MKKNHRTQAFAQVRFTSEVIDGRQITIPVTVWREGAIPCCIQPPTPVLALWCC